MIDHFALLHDTLGLYSLTPDMVNAALLLVAGIIQWANCWRTYKDKCIKGVHPSLLAFMWCWTLWSITYFYNLTQYYSMLAECHLFVAVNVWVWQAWGYREKK